MCFLLGDEGTEALLPSLDSDAMLVQLHVFLGSHGSYNKNKENKTKTCIISALPISPKSKWDLVDHLVVKGFKVRILFLLQIIVSPFHLFLNKIIIFLTFSLF